MTFWKLGVRENNNYYYYYYYYYYACSVFRAAHYSQAARVNENLSGPWRIMRADNDGVRGPEWFRYVFRGLWGGLRGFRYIS